MHCAKCWIVYIVAQAARVRQHSINEKRHRFTVPF